MKTTNPAEAVILVGIVLLIWCLALGSLITLFIFGVIP